MERRELPADRGMSFDFGAPQLIHMWMKNTYIPLDMIFLDGTVSISANKAHPRVTYSLGLLYLGALPSATDGPLHLAHLVIALLVAPVHQIGQWFYH
jgi:hypothetical protein